MGANLLSLDLQDCYRSDRDDVVRDFYVPVLSEGVSYDRAVGYFTATSLALFSRALNRLTARDGRIRLIASPHLLEEDADDIARGYAMRQVVERAALRELATTMPSAVEQGLGYLGQLIAEGTLDLKLAFLRSRGNLALYHEKIGLVRDNAGNAVAFSGSANETLGGLVANFESIEVYRSWDERDARRVLRISRDFDQMWANETPNLEVAEFPSVAERVVAVSRARRSNPLIESDFAIDPAPTTTEASSADTAGLQMPAGFVPRGYQRDAVEAWFRGGLRGVFKMATGTGKTKTALTAAAKLAEALSRQGLPLATVVVVPYQHLVDQWVDEMSEFGVRAIPLYGSSRDWGDRGAAIVDAANLHRGDVNFVTTTSTFALTPFRELSSRIRIPILLIGDEVHNLGARGIRDQLPMHAKYRLGLSATPERWFDDDGTRAIFDYFGQVVYEFDMERAIATGALCRYYYRPRLVELDSVETELYGHLTDAIAAQLATGEDAEDPDSALGQLLRKRSAVLGHAAGKLPMLRTDLEARRHEWFQLLYCAEGRRPTEEGYEDGPRQLDHVLQMVGLDLGLTSHSYVSETPRVDRRRLLKRFASGDDLKVLVSMRCLDEGVDVPDARVAYLLASSSNPRQFIQRRGRILRPAPGKDSAEILDYLAVPSTIAPGRFEVERRLVERELQRATEFAQLSENYGEALVALREVKSRYGLMDV